MEGTSSGRKIGTSAGWGDWPNFWQLGGGDPQSPSGKKPWYRLGWLLRLDWGCTPSGFKPQGGRNSSFQFGNPRWHHPGSATVNSVCIAALFESKVHVKTIQRGVQGPNGFSYKIILHIWFKQVLNFFICSSKIMCKPMENFAKIINLGKHVLPPPPHQTYTHV